MARDCKGRALRPGDEVIVHCRVISVDDDSHPTAVTLEPLDATDSDVKAEPFDTHPWCCDLVADVHAATGDDTPA